MELSVIIPCFNCSDQIIKNFIKIKKKILKHFKSVEFILVDDGSHDKTRKELKNIKKKFKNIILIFNQKNLGKSSSVRKGIKIAKGKKILVYDSDIPYFIYLEKLLKKLKYNKLVIINRRSDESKVIIKSFTIYKLLRFITGNIISYISRMILNIKIKDTQAGLKGFENSREIKNFKFVSKKFFLDIEIIMFFLKKKIKPVFINVHNLIDNNPSSIRIINFKKNIKILKEYFFFLKRYF